MKGTTWAKVETVQPCWHLVDVKGEILGRVAARIAGLLRGKDRVLFTPWVDPQTHVIVINASQIRVTGAKLAQKVYRRYSGYPSGYREIPLAVQLARRPTEVIRHAVQGMLPKSRLGRHLLRNLKVYAGSEHPHLAQGPKRMELPRRPAGAKKDA